MARIAGKESQEKEIKIKIEPGQEGDLLLKRGRDHESNSDNEGRPSKRYRTDEFPLLATPPMMPSNPSTGLMLPPPLPAMPKPVHPPAAPPRPLVSLSREFAPSSFSTSSVSHTYPLGGTPPLTGATWPAMEGYNPLSSSNKNFHTWFANWPGLDNPLETKQVTFLPSSSPISSASSAYPLGGTPPIGGYNPHSIRLPLFPLGGVEGMQFSPTVRPSPTLPLISALPSTSKPKSPPQQSTANGTGAPTRLTTTTAHPPATVVTTRPSVQENDEPLKMSYPSLEEIDQLILKAKNEDGEAQEQLIDIFFVGAYESYLTSEKIGFLQWKTASFKDIETLCYNNDQVAMYAIYNLLVTNDFPILFEVVKDRAERGNSFAQYNLGSMYYMQKNYAKAEEWFNESACDDNPFAQFSLSRMYSRGDGVEKNLRVAADFYLAAAHQGNALAQHHLSCAYANGWGVKQDHVKAVEWTTKAALQGNAVAQHNLAGAYASGQGVKQDHVKAIEWYTKAALQGNAADQHHLAVAYMRQGGEQDHVKAVEWTTKAALQGNVAAQHNLGFYYGEGKGVKQDHVKAVEWYTKAALQGNASAQGSLAYAYAKGLGVKQDDVKAFEWYTKAARQGNTIAQHNLGVCYETGTGVERNLMTAFYYNLLGKQGQSRLFLSSDAFYVPFSSGSKTPWREALRRAIGQEDQYGLAFLKKRFQEKITAAEKRQEAKVPTYIHLYKTAHAIVVAHLTSIDTILKKYKPGFMVPGLYFSKDLLNDYYKQAAPQYVAHCDVEGTIYMSFGEENIKLQNSLLICLRAADENFKSADKALKKLAKIFYGQKDYEAFQAESMKKSDDPTLKEDCQKLCEKINKLGGPLEEIERQRKALANIHKGLKNFIRSTAKDRQDEFLTEYPFFSIGQF